MKSLHETRNNIHKKGFTIVELLIVIVVIGILAGFATVTAGSVRKRALNISYLATYNEVYKALRAKLVTDGYTAFSAPEGQLCIGETLDRDGDTVGDCDYYQPDNGSAYTYTHESSSFNTEMAKISKKMPGKLSQPFEHYIQDPDEGGPATLTQYNVILHGYTNVPPEQDPSGEMRFTNGGKAAYLFGGALYGDNEDCGAKSVRITNIYNESGRQITELSPSRNEPILSLSGMTYCMYGVEAL